MDFYSNENEVSPMTSQTQMARVAISVNQNASSAMVCRVASRMSYELYHHVYHRHRQHVAMVLSRRQLEHVLKYRSKRRENKVLYSNHMNSLLHNVFALVHLHQISDDIWDFDLQSNQVNRPRVFKIRLYHRNSKTQRLFVSNLYNEIPGVHPYHIGQLLSIFDH